MFVDLAQNNHTIPETIASKNPKRSDRALLLQPCIRFMLTTWVDPVYFPQLTHFRFPWKTVNRCSTRSCFGVSTIPPSLRLQAVHCFKDHGPTAGAGAARRQPRHQGARGSRPSPESGGDVHGWETVTAEVGRSLSLSRSLTLSLKNRINKTIQIMSNPKE